MAQSLADDGFEVMDIILKKWTQGPEPTVLTYEESKFESLDRTIEKSTEDLNARKKARATREEDLKKFKDGDDKVFYRVLAEREYVIRRQQGEFLDRAKLEKDVEQIAKQWSDEQKKVW